MVSEKSPRTAIVCVLTFQIVLIVLFAIFVKYGKDSDARTSKDQFDNEDLDTMYPCKLLKKIDSHFLGFVSRSWDYLADKSCWQPLSKTDLLS